MTVVGWVVGGLLGASAAVIAAWVGLCWWFGDRDLFKQQYPESPGGGDDGIVPRREPAAGPLDRFADDIRATLGHPPSDPAPYDYYTDRHPKPSAPPAGPPNGGGAGLRTPRRTGTHKAPSVKEGRSPIDP